MNTATDPKTLLDACLRRVTETSYAKEDIANNEKLISKLIEMEPLLKKIHVKSQKRSLTDKKVAPGSDDVVCSILNARYCLCLININMGKYYELQSDTYDLAISCYQRALIWYPKSIEAGHLLGLCLRSRAVTTSNLEFVQFVWERAIAASQSLDSLTADGGPSAELFMSASEQKVCNILLSDDISLLCASVEPEELGSSVAKAQTSVIYRERMVTKSLQDSLILFYCQENQPGKAYSLLLLKRYQWKLSQQLLTYTTNGFSGSQYIDHRQKELEARQDFPFTFGCDSVLPEQYLRRLQHVFRPSSPFWSEHQYDFYSNCSRKVGYFSYLYPFRERPASNVIEQVIDIVYRTVVSRLKEGEAKDNGSRKACLEALRSEALTAEWWVHSRPHSSGHQFHFDSDETALYGGEQAQHPIASCIVYLSEGVGGPTVVTNQTLASPNLASYGYLMRPKENRLAMFDASFLHGVVPGRGLCPTQESGAEGRGQSRVEPQRRLSFMVGFWRKIKAQDRGPGCPGPGQPFPDNVASPATGELNHPYTWPDEMTEMLPPAPPGDGCRVVYPQRVEPIWEHVSACTEATSALYSTGGSVAQEEICAQYSTCFQGF